MAYGDARQGGRKTAQSSLQMYHGEHHFLQIKALATSTQRPCPCRPLPATATQCGLGHSPPGIRGSALSVSCEERLRSCGKSSRRSVGLWVEESCAKEECKVGRGCGGGGGVC